MNTLVIVPLILCIIHANATDKQEVKGKTTSPTINTIQQNPKYEMIYQPVKFQQPLQQQIQLQPLQFQPKPQYIPIQFIPRQFLVPQHQPQPQAMIIIAQPGLLPQNLVYGNPMQQLLNYFHSNPQARYQFLHGNQQQQPQPTVQPTATYMHPVVATPSVGNYIFATPQVPTPVATQHQVIAQATPVPAPALQYLQQQYQQPQQQHQQQQPQQQQHHQQQQQQQPPTQLTNIAHLAQLAAQQYLTSQMKTAPAIVTGFENFTPEQQAQIKAQLSTHLGSNFHAVSNQGNNQYSSKYVAEQDNNNFTPSQQIKNDAVTTISSQTADILKTRYMKQKN